VDDKRVSITDNISSVTISRTTADKLQRKEPVIRQGKPSKNPGKHNDSEALSMTVHPSVWAAARERAEDIATVIVREQSVNPDTELSPEAKVKIRTIANRLIVINDDLSVTVHNNIAQATTAKNAAKQAKKDTPSESTPA
jgi:hypothetical protein